MATLTNPVANNNLSVPTAYDNSLNQSVVKSSLITLVSTTSAFTQGVQKQAAENFNWG